MQQFDGPLDLLLQLIQKARIPIEDIFISQITGEYVRIVGELDQYKLEDASDFIALAAQLLYLKSRRLLPAPPPLQEEEEDPELAFIRRLEEYQRCKAAAIALRPLYEQGQDSFSRLPMELPAAPVEAYLPDADKDSLFMALLSALKGLPEKEEQAPTHRVRRDVYTVRERSSMLRERLRETPSLPFAQLFTCKPSHMELVVTLMAVLELMARGEIRVLQKDTFAPIRLRAVALSEGDEGSYMDEEELL